jgi:diacylglycerol kinase family enzyme
LVNPISGNRSALETAERVQRLLREAGHEARLETTTSKGDAGQRARAAVKAQEDAVIVCGGDGTLQEVAGALAGTAMPMGLILRRSAWRTSLWRVKPARWTWVQWERGFF